jgi:hypothetical protein
LGSTQYGYGDGATGSIPACEIGTHSESSAPIHFVNAMNALRFAMGVPMVVPMTFIIEAIKDDHRLTEIRSSAIVAVILARKLAAEGFAVSISAPTGALYSADKFNLLLTSKSLDSQAVAGDG